LAGLCANGADTGDHIELIEWSRGLWRRVT